MILVYRIHCQNRINRFGEIVNNANNIDIVGAGFACPIMQPDAHLQPQPGVHSQNEQWGHAWHVMQHGWHGQANPAQFFVRGTQFFKKSPINPYFTRGLFQKSKMCGKQERFRAQSWRQRTLSKSLLSGMP